MTSLLIDTATDYGVVGIFSEGRLLAKKEFAAAFTNSRLLLPAIDELVKSLQIDPKELTYIATGIGPGSYTGIRVAVALAKAISFAHGIPLVGVSSLKGFVPDASFSGTFVAAIDARIGGVYAVTGLVKNGMISFNTADALVSADDFLKMAKSVSCVVTPQKAALVKRFPELEHVIIERSPSLEELGSLAYEAFCKGHFACDGRLPLAYLRKTQAEIEKENKGL
jgi:tRNA threonylcarbamoyladenosine biosynthesis protein TsaB